MASKSMVNISIGPTIYGMFLNGEYSILVIHF